MRLLFEIGHLKTATPATVSRAGILFLNYADVGWNPYVSSWIDTREVQSEKANLQILFDKYVPICLDTLRVRFKKITPVPDITMVTTLCYLLECLLNPTNTPPDCNKELYELYFVFAAVWAFGGAMFQDQVCISAAVNMSLLAWENSSPAQERRLKFHPKLSILVSLLYKVLYGVC